MPIQAPKATHEAQPAHDGETMTDRVLIVGGGVMGCTSALALAQAGADVEVLERSVPGAEASSAAAGMLGAQVEARKDEAFLRLCIASRDRFPAFADTLKELSGIDVEYRRSGILRVAEDERAAAELSAWAAWQREQQLEATWLDRVDALEVEPALGPSAVGGVWLENDGRVDPPRLLKALRIAAERAGARFRSGAMVSAIAQQDGRAIGVDLHDGERLGGDWVVLAAGSWSSLVATSAAGLAAVQPAKGQILELVTQVPTLRTVVFGADAYLCGRDDGRTIIGSTLEFVGFQRGVTARAVRDLLVAATRLVPALENAELSRTWASFRPYTSDERPLIGPCRIERLVLATGHYRNGILLAPITGDIVARSIAGEPTPVPLDAFRPQRSMH